MLQTQSLSALTRRSLESLTLLTEHLNSASGYNQRLDDIQQRFKLWSGNIGALHSLQDQKSLAYRVKESPKMEALFAELLQDVGDDLDELGSLLDSHDAKAADEDFDLAFDDLIESLNESIRTLFKTSGIARRAATRDRYTLALKKVPSSKVTHEEVDFERIGDLFPRLRLSRYDWLRAKLAKANNLRRRYLQYCEEHQVRVEAGTSRGQDYVEINLAQPEIPLPNPVDEVLAEKSSQAARSTATTVDAAALEAATTGEDDIESMISVFSYATDSAAPMRYRVVDLEEVNNGEEYFICPYCRKELSCTSQGRWKKHVLSDIKAYVCIDADCVAELFDDSHSWMQHQLLAHLIQRNCPYCKEDHSYDTANELETHLYTEHKSKFHEEQLAQICKLSEQEPAVIPASACPFCDWQAKLEYRNPSQKHDSEISVSLQRYRRHIGSHLEQVALAVLQTEDAEGSDDSKQGSNEWYTDREDISLDNHGERDGADVDAQDEQYGISLGIASATGDEALVQLPLTDGADADDPGGRFGATLYAACEKGDYTLVRLLLLANGANVNAQAGDYGNALQAASFGGYEEVVQLLLEMGADVNALGGQYGNALQAASWTGSEQLVKTLLAAGADVNAQGGTYGNAVVAVLEKMLAEDRPDRLALQYTLAGVHQANGEAKKAVDLLEHVVAVQGNLLAADHPNRLASQQTLAGAYQANGEVKKAVDLLEHVVAVKEDLLAVNHPDRLASQQTLADAYQANGEVKKAVDLLKHVIAVRGELLAKDRASYGVGIICALPLEKAAVMAMLDEEHIKLPGCEGDIKDYTLGRIGKHDVVVACQPAEEPSEALEVLVAPNMTSSFPIRLVLSVGIGGGVPSKSVDIRLGDVVVSQPTDWHGGVIQWDFGKKTKSGGMFRRTGMLNKPPQVLRNALSGLQARHEVEEPDLGKHLEEMLSRRPRMAEKYKHQGRENDWLFEADYVHAGGETCKECDQKRLVRRATREDEKKIVVHAGNIASGDQVMKDGTTRDRIAASERVICFEMEATGLVGSLPCLMIRGICDYADSHKHKQWQRYAAAAAAAYAKELLLAMAAA